VTFLHIKEKVAVLGMIHYKIFKTALTARDAIYIEQCLPPWEALKNGKKKNSNS